MCMIAPVSGSAVLGYKMGGVGFGVVGVTAGLIIAAGNFFGMLAVMKFLWDRCVQPIEPTISIKWRKLLWGSFHGLAVLWMFLSTLFGILITYLLFRWRMR